MAGEAADDTDPGGWVEGDPGAPVTGYSDGAAPGVLDLELHAREEELESFVQGAHGAGVHGAQAWGTGVEGVRGAAAADGDAAVGGALGVDEGVRGVAEALVPLPADLLPGAVGELLGHDHRGVDGDDVPRVESAGVAVDLPRVRFHAGQDRLAADNSA